MPWMIFNGKRVFRFIGLLRYFVDIQEPKVRDHILLKKDAIFQWLIKMENH